MANRLINTDELPNIYSYQLSEAEALPKLMEELTVLLTQLGLHTYANKITEYEVTVRNIHHIFKEVRELKESTKNDE